MSRCGRSPLPWRRRFSRCAEDWSASAADRGLACGRNRERLRFVASGLPGLRAKGNWHRASWPWPGAVGRVARGCARPPALPSTPRSSGREGQSTVGVEGHHRASPASFSAGEASKKTIASRGILTPGRPLEPLLGRACYPNIPPVSLDKRSPFGRAARLPGGARRGPGSRAARPHRLICLSEALNSDPALTASAS